MGSDAEAPPTAQTGITGASLEFHQDCDVTVAGLYDYFQRGRKEVIDSHSGQDEHEDQSDDVPPEESNDGQTSSQDSSGPPQFFHISEESVTADPRVGDDWIDDTFHVFNCAMSKFNANAFQTPVHVAPDTSVDVTRRHQSKDVPPEESNDGQTSSQDSSGPPQFFHISEEPVTADPRVGDDWIDDTFHVFNCAMSKFNADAFQTPVHVAPDTSVDITRASDSLAEDKRIIMDISSCGYEMGVALGEGGFGVVYAATRLKDGLQVAVKFASKEHTRYARVHGYSRPIPLEVALHMLANRGPSVPHIIKLLDWQDKADLYIMVLERPMPCQTLDDFLLICTDTKYEDSVRIIMQQATFAAQACCQRGVLHRDIKLENLLINPDTFEVKLIDFGCGEFLNSAGYTSFSGTKEYCPRVLDKRPLSRETSDGVVTRHTLVRNAVREFSESSRPGKDKTEHLDQKWLVTRMLRFDLLLSAGRPKEED